MEYLPEEATEQLIGNDSWDITASYLLCRFMNIETDWGM